MDLNAAAVNPDRNDPTWTHTSANAAG